MTLDELPTSARPPRLRSHEVPAAARQYIPLAERYGIGDDGYRDDIVLSLKPLQVEELLQYLSKYPKEIDDWLCGPASKSLPPTDEYVAFTCLLMAAQYAKAVHGEQRAT